MVNKVDDLSDSIKSQYAWRFLQIKSTCDAMGGFANFKYWVNKHANNYFKTCEKLEKQLSELREELKAEREVVDFYAKGSTW